MIKKSLIKADECMTFYNETKPLYLKTDASGIGLGATLLQHVEKILLQTTLFPGPSH